MMKICRYSSCGRRNTREGKLLAAEAGEHHVKETVATIDKLELKGVTMRHRKSCTVRLYQSSSRISCTSITRRLRLCVKGDIGEARGARGTGTGSGAGTEPESEPESESEQGFRARAQAEALHQEIITTIVAMNIIVIIVIIMIRCIVLLALRTSVIEVYRQKVGAPAAAAVEVGWAWGGAAVGARHCQLGWTQKPRDLWGAQALHHGMIPLQCKLIAVENQKQRCGKSSKRAESWPQSSNHGLTNASSRISARVMRR